MLGLAVLYAPQIAAKKGSLPFFAAIWASGVKRRSRELCYASFLRRDRLAADLDLHVQGVPTKAGLEGPLERVSAADAHPEFPLVPTRRPPQLSR
jgi:hypothetical protein